MEMIVSTDIDALVARRNAIFKELEGARDAFDRAKNIYEDGAGFESYKGSGKREKFERFPWRNSVNHSEDMEAMMKGYDAKAWEYLMDASGLESLMSTSTCEGWHKQISNCETPPLTKENIVATFKDLFVRKDEIFEQGVIEAFRSCSWDHKTNQPVKFGKKVIFAGRWGNSHLQEVDDLRRVLHVSDGKPQPDHRHGVYAEFLRHDSIGLFEDDYVQVEKFKNGNVHCKFKRPDLTTKLNAILAKHHPNALPAPR